MSVSFLRLGAWLLHWHLVFVGASGYQLGSLHGRMLMGGGGIKRHNGNSNDMKESNHSGFDSRQS